MHLHHMPRSAKASRRRRRSRVECTSGYLCYKGTRHHRALGAASSSTIKEGPEGGLGSRSRVLCSLRRKGRDGTKPVLAFRRRAIARWKAPRVEVKMRPRGDYQLQRENNCDSPREVLTLQCTPPKKGLRRNKGRGHFHTFPIVTLFP